MANLESLISYLPVMQTVVWEDVATRVVLYMVALKFGTIFIYTI